MAAPSVYLLVPVSKAGEEWLENNLEDTPRLGFGYAVEWRYIGEILEGMKNDGLTGADVEVQS